MQLPFATVHEAFQASARRWPDRPFIHIPQAAATSYSAQDIDLTYAQAAARISGLRTSYAAQGLRRGHRVAAILDNRADFFLHYLALNSLGISLVPMNGEAAPAEIAHVLRDSGTVLVVALSDHRALLEAATLELRAPLLIAWVQGHDIAWPVTCNPETPGTASDDEAALLYTSGSTGAPKGCMLSNRYMVTMGNWYRTVGGICELEDGQERLLTPLPLVHMNALAASCMVMILAGGCIIQLDRFHPRSWWSTVRDSGATVIHYLGVMPAILLQAPESGDDPKHAVKFGFGAGVHPKHHGVFEQRFALPLVESWSMTEVGGAAAIIAAREPRHVGERCFGRPGDNLEYRIVDAHGQDVAAGTAGELWVRAVGADPRAGFFSGYANQAALTEAAWSHGYFQSGDIVQCGPDGCLHFVDRKKSIVRRSGENIASLEVEAVLNQLPGVQSVGVGPVQDEIRGEEVMACIQLKPDVAADEVTAVAIFNAAAERLVYFKTPGYIAFLPQLPLTPSQKLQRGELKSISEALVASGEAFDLRQRKKRPQKH